MDYNINNYKLNSFLSKNSINAPEEPERYKLIDIDHPNGWSFNEIDTLGDMGFKIDSDYEMVCEIEVGNLEMNDTKVPVKAYKNEEGYVLETNRRYVFETFNKMLEFIDTIPSDKDKRN